MTNVIVIGGGPGGTATATRAAQLGAKVTLIERDKLGGGCVNYNCIPLKGMLASVELYEKAQRAANLGVELGTPQLNLTTARERVNGIVEELRAGTQGLMGSFGVEVIQGEARLESPQSVLVDGKRLQADAVVLATGAVPCEPPVQAPGMLSTREALALEQAPARLLIWGGGLIEVEYAQYFALQGCKVTLVTEQGSILPEEDYEISQRLQSILSGQGIQILTRAQVQPQEPVPGGVPFRVTQRKGEQTVEVDRWLWAGYRPAIEGLDLERLGVAVEDGAVKVDNTLRTNLPHLYAVGDLTGHPMYSYVATVGGLVAAENILGQKRTLDLKAMPRCIFTIPEVAAVGLTENEAEDRGYEVEVVNTSLETNVRAMLMDEAVGGIKSIFDRKYGKLLGVHIVGHRAVELIAEAALAIQMEAVAEDLAWAVRGHPTLCETLVETGRAFAGQALYIPKW